MRELDARLLEKISVRVPSDINEEILSFCKILNSELTPEFVDVTPASGAVTGECYDNARSQMRLSGGDVVFGWVIWIWPRVFLEAEHHAVWSDGGRLVDVTPPIDGEDKLLFLPDSNTVFDYKKRKRIPSRRMSLSNSSSVSKYLDALNQYDAEVKLAGAIGERIRVDLRRLNTLESEVVHYQNKVIFELTNQIGRNDLCICGRNVKFKKCCLPLVG